MIDDNKTVTVDILNGVLDNELSAILQYFFHSKLLADKGLCNLAKKMREASIDEMHHADCLTDRIIFLGGRPEMKNVSGMSIETDIENILKSDLKLEKNAIDYLQKSINELDNDTGTEDLLKEILKSEEKHMDWIQSQLSLIKLIGVKEYLIKNG